MESIAYMGLYTHCLYLKQVIWGQSQAEKKCGMFCSETGEAFSCFPSAWGVLVSGPAPAKVVFPTFASWSVNSGTDNKTEMGHMAYPWVLIAHFYLSQHLLGLCQNLFWVSHDSRPEEAVGMHGFYSRGLSACKIGEIWSIHPLCVILLTLV